MNKNISDKLLNMIKGMDKDKLKNSVDMVSKFMSSDEGKRLSATLSDSDKKAILDKFMSMDDKETGEKLKNADLSKLDNISIDDIIKKIK